MKFPKTILSEKWFFIFPLLIAIYPIIFFYANNVQELLLSQIFIPCAIALTTTAICWILLTFLIKDTLKAGMATTVFVVFFYSYGVLFSWVNSLNILSIRHWHFLPIVLFIAAYLGYFIYLIKTRDLLVNAAKILTVIVTMLLVLSLITVIPTEIEKTGVAHQKIISNEYQPTETQSHEYPDIYYIILDEYASTDTIKKLYNYDNGNFTDFLERAGFYITTDSKTPYPVTQWSIASSLNMDYNGKKIDPYVFMESINQNDPTLTDLTGMSNVQVFGRYSNNRVIKILRSYGYKIITFDNLYLEYPIAGLMDSDEHYIVTLQDNHFFDDFSWQLLQNSMMKPFLFFFNPNTDYNYYSKFRISTLYSLEELKKIPSQKGPKFIYVHILCPHSPFVFDQQGNEVDKANYLNWKDKKYYLDQYIFISEQTREIVSKIQSDSKGKAVIIIQSDHGPRASWAPVDQNLDIPLSEQLKIFNAYYLPSQNYGNFSENTSPVNSFRLVFNEIFGTKYELVDTN
jgi:hypothetical protein